MKRLETLDSIRGIAAVTVLLFHLCSVFPSFLSESSGAANAAWRDVIRYTPLSVIVSGHSAVILFFVLSGFVLALPFLNEQKRVGYAPFVIKRICRIYIPYWFAIVLAALISQDVPLTGWPDLSDWFVQFWHADLTPGLLIRHIVLIGDFNTDSLDFVIWSLVHEARLSLVFPLMMIVVNRWSWIRTTALFGLVSLGNAVALAAVRHYTDWSPKSAETLHYAFMFAIGALLAKHRETLVGAVRKLPLKVAWMPPATAVMLYTYPSAFFHSAGLLHLWFWDDWLVALGSGVTIVLALSSPSFVKLLQRGPVVALGRISYSLYLLHPIVMLAAVRLLHGRLPLPMLATACIPLSLATAAFSYRFVERSSVYIGRRLAERISARASAVSAAMKKIARYES